MKKVTKFKAEIISVDSSNESSDKRQSLPFQIKYRCECGKEHVHNYSDGNYYISHPRFGDPKHFNSPNTAYFYCDKCDAEYELEIKLTVNAEIINIKKS